MEEFASRDIRWTIARLIYLHHVDMVQIEYTPMAQYLEPYRHVLTALFEHDVYFQSIIRTAQYFSSPVARLKARFEYLRALRYELGKLRETDQVQVCTRANRDYLLEFAPQLAPTIHAGLRAAVDTSAYGYPGGNREPNTILFIGSSRHEPNAVGVEWFVNQVFPTVVAGCPQVRFYLVGFDREKNLQLGADEHIRLLGFVEDVKPLLATYAAFVCPILSGSGVRVKLLEAFAAGIPVVSTRVGAEGLTRGDAALCALSDDPAEFARHILAIFEEPEEALAMAARARREVVENWDSAAVTTRLEISYREGLRRKNPSPTEEARPPKEAAILS